MLVLGRNPEGEEVAVETEQHIDELLWQKTKSLVVVHLRFRDGRGDSIRAEHLSPEGHALLRRWIGNPEH